MRVTIALMVAACVLVAGIARADEAKKADKAANKDLESLQGKWVAVGREVLGKKATEQELKDQKTYVVIEGNKGKAWMEGQGGKTDTSEGTLTLGPSATPKAVNITYTRGLLKGYTVPAIYELNGDTLKVCFAWQSKDRPTTFAGDAEGKTILVIYNRTKN